MTKFEEFNELLKKNRCIPAIKVSKEYSLFNTEEQARAIIEKTFIDSGFVKKFVWYDGYDKICKWMVNTQGKGLFLVGNTGLGKTRLLLTITYAFYERGLVVKPYKSYQLTSELANELLTKPVIAIDEIGREPLGNNYGVKYEPLEILIDGCESSGITLIATSNLKSEKLIERYGQPIYNRLIANCETIVFKGESLRK